ncbi:MAG: DUF4386 family protein [Flavipsychrobacter sp.]
MLKDIGASATNRQWSSLYQMAAIAAMMVSVFIPIQGTIFTLWPPPDNVMDWFALFQRNKFVGLLDMDLLLTADYILLLLIFLALWAALRKTNRSLATLALAFQLAGTAAYFASTAAFEMLSLSNQYTAAKSDMERIIYWAAAQAAYANWQGTAFNVSYFLGFVALVAISVVMLKSTTFSKATAYLGLVAGMLMVVPPTVGRVGMVLSFLSLIPTIPRLILVYRRLLQLSKTENENEVKEESRTLSAIGTNECLRYIGYIRNIICRKRYRLIKLYQFSIKAAEALICIYRFIGNRIVVSFTCFTF